MIIIVRAATGQTCSYPVVETTHKDRISPRIRPAPESKSRRSNFDPYSRGRVKSLDGACVLGGEMLLLGDGQILVNDSGHYTTEACETSQYENLFRTILSLPVGSTALKVPSAAMLNILSTSNDMSEITNFEEFALIMPGASIHQYGKAQCCKGRKMGHITLTAETDAKIRARGAQNAIGVLPQATSSWGHHLLRLGLPAILPAAHILDRFCAPYKLTVVSAHRTPD